MASERMRDDEGLHLRLTSRFPLLFPRGEPGWHDKIPFTLNEITGNAHQDDGYSDVEDAGEGKIKLLC